MLNRRDANGNGNAHVEVPGGRISIHWIQAKQTMKFVYVLGTPGDFESVDDLSVSMKSGNADSRFTQLVAFLQKNGLAQYGQAVWDAMVAINLTK